MPAKPPVPEPGTVPALLLEASDWDTRFRRGTIWVHEWIRERHRLEAAVAALTPLSCPTCLGTAISLHVLTHEHRRILSVDRTELHTPFDCEEPQYEGDYDSDRQVDAEGHPYLSCDVCGAAWFEQTIVTSGTVATVFSPPEPGL